MRGAPRLPDSRAGTSMHLRVPGSLLQPAASALVARLSLTAGLRAPAGRYLTLPPLHETGTTPHRTSCSPCMLFSLHACMLFYLHDSMTACGACLSPMRQGTYGPRGGLDTPDTIPTILIIATIAITPRSHGAPLLSS